MSAQILLTAGKIPSGSPILDFDIVVLGGHPLLVCTDFACRVFTWDPVSDQWARYRLDNPWLDEELDFTEVGRIGAAVVDGRIVIGGGGDHQGFAQWDLASGEVRTYARYGGVASASAVVVGGRTLFVVGCTGPAVQLWDPSVRETGHAADGHGDHRGAEPIEVAEMDGGHAAAGTFWNRPVVVSNGLAGGVLVWDVDSDEPLTGYDDLEGRLCCFALCDVADEGRLVAAGERILVTDDPHADAWQEPLIAPGGDIECLDAAVVGGRAVAVTGAEDGTVCAWDLAEQRLLGQPITEHDGEVFAVRATEMDGRPVAISAGRDGVMRVWALPQL